MSDNFMYTSFTFTPHKFFLSVFNYDLSTVVSLVCVKEWEVGRPKTHFFNIMTMVIVIAILLFL